MLGNKSVGYQQQIWELQDRYAKISAQKQAVAQHLEKISALYANGSVTLLQYDQMIRELLQGKARDDIMGELDREAYECQKSIQQLEMRMGEIDQYIVHENNHHKLNTLFLGIALLLFLGLLLSMSHPTAYVVLP